FLLASAISGILWRYYNDRLLINKLSLEYDLAQERQRLKLYSEQLEKLVAERTKELRKSETMLRSLYEKANDTIILTDENGKIINVNKKVTEQYGYTKEELIGKSLLSLEQNQDNQLFLERNHRLLHGEPLVYESTHIAKDGTPVHVEVSASAVTLEEGKVIQFIIRDITEKKKLQAQLLHAQRMESLGTLAGGIAHDFNNLLTSIMGYTDLILDEGKLPPELVPKMRVIESSTRKATQIVSKLLNFAKRGRELELVPFNVNDMIKEALELAKRRFNPNIEVDLDLKENLPIIKGDVGLLEQSVLNLILNAIDAMPEGGNLNLETDLVKIDSNYKKRIAPDVKEGPYIRISVKDTGSGIPPDKIDRIFDPFFTTKGPDKGTGLGLAMTYGIIKDHGGYITVDSIVGKGTTFEIYLPASQTVIPGITSILDSLRTTGKIMVIDDEIPVLEFFKVTLLQKGFNVVVFNEPYTAYEYFKNHKSLIELVISDIVMPEIDGKKLIKELKSFKNDVKIIAMSGFKDALLDLQADGYLVKPVKKDTLFQEIQRVMASPGKTC
ncbi:MAG: PAS domain S-box protein, partial [Nitrospirae bacterium]|nr:PAS domain S-box protein [Nitrospirota bacterium]